MDSEGEDITGSNTIRSEFFCGGGEDDSDVQEDIEGDPTVRRQALFQMTLNECKAFLRRDRELERATAPGRHKEADMQMKVSKLFCQHTDPIYNMKDMRQYY